MATNTSTNWNGPIAGKRRRSSLKTPIIPGSLATGKIELDGHDGKFTMEEDAPKIVVGLDFGTTYSGFTYALTSDIQSVHEFYDWPGQALAGGKPYCKTETSLRYVTDETNGSEFYLEDWGCHATINHRQALEQCRFTGSELKSCLVNRFKLLLAPVSSNGSTSSSEPNTLSLPEGLTAERTIADYLRSMSAFIMKMLVMKLGSFATKREVQWCLTVPAIWDDIAKQKMIMCAEKAGLVTGPCCEDEDASRHPIIIVLEPEAAAVYCESKFRDFHFGKGFKYLIVDAGGGTVDLVVHEKMNSSGPKVKEVACPTGLLCGGSFVNDGFLDYLEDRVSCYKRFREDFPATDMRMQKQIEEQKYSYDGESEAFAINLDVPAKLATAWENSDKANGTWHENGKYDDITISEKEVRHIFDRVVNPIVELIRAQIVAVPGIEAIMVVGGFSTSPYLMNRIKDEFSTVVKHILNPPSPGSAVCRGAVAFGALGGDFLVSRKCRKTYEISIARPFQIGDPPEFLSREEGQFMCQNVFSIFIRKGDDVPVDSQLKRKYEIPRGLTTPEVEIYATDAAEPKFVTDTGVQRVGAWIYRLPRQAQRMHDAPIVEVVMFFGRTTLKIMLVPVNFRAKAQHMTCVVQLVLCWVYLLYSLL